MSFEDLALLQFHDGYLEKIWGGQKFRSVLAKPAPEGQIGEDWLVADHPQHQSRVAHGAQVGKTLGELIQQSPELILGTRPRLTPDGRFPLLLKLIDAAEPLSVQVHPNDAQAAELGEPDVGKTEMWHVLEADPGSELICGLHPDLDAASLRQAVEAGSVGEEMVHFPARAGTTVFVPAGTVHAIGAGVLLAEIQQNSDITYRIYDYKRVDDSGKPRDLHLDKGLRVTNFGHAHAGPNTPLSHPLQSAECEVLGGCRYFAARKLRIEGTTTLQNNGQTFHILLLTQGHCRVTADGAQASLAPFLGTLAAGATQTIQLEGNCEVLDFFVPDLARDIRVPLQQAGHPEEAIQRLLA